MIKLWWNTMLFLKLLLIPPADFLWKRFGWDSRRISVFFEIRCKQMATKLLVLSKKKLLLEFFGFPKFVSYHRLFDAATILFLLRIGQNCKSNTLIQICGRPQKNTVTAEALIVWLFFKQYDISHSRMTSDMICMPQIQSLALKSKSEIWHKSKRHGY